MDELVNSLKNLSLHKDLKLRYLPFTAATCQKCYVAKNILKCRNLNPGDVVLVDGEKTHICKVFSSFEECSGLLDVCPTVELNHNRNRAKLKQHGEFEMFKISELPIHTFVEIDLIFEYHKDKMIWLRHMRQLLHLVKNFMVNTFVFGSECNIICDNTHLKKVIGVKQIHIKKCNSHHFGYLTQKTNLTINKIYDSSQYSTLKNRKDEIYGMESMIQNILDIVHCSLRSKKHVLQEQQLSFTQQILLAGPSGCGKSSLVQHIANKMNCTLITLAGAQVSDSSAGASEANLRNIFNEAFSYAKSDGMCILHLEEIDILCPGKSQNTNHITRVRSQLLQLMDEAQNVPGLVIIATTNKPANIDSSIRRHGRLAKEFYIGVPSESDRRLIIYNIMKRNSPTLHNDLLHQISSIVGQITQGYVGADLKCLCMMTLLNVEKDKLAQTANQATLLDGYVAQFKYNLSKMKPATLRSQIFEIVAKGVYQMENIGGMIDIKKSLEMSISWPLLYSEKFKKFGIPNTKGILLYGPPGCAKTSLVRALAGTGNITVISVTSAHIYSPFVGDAEKTIVQLFDKARQNTPCVIFIDEIDALICSRNNSDSSSDVQQKVLAALLTQMDGIGNILPVADYAKKKGTDGNDVIVIAATNRPNEIDGALLRPGRFDRHIYVPCPDLECRLEILKVLVKNTPLGEDIDLEDIAQRTEFFSGADLKNLHTEAVLHAMKTEGLKVDFVKKSHFDEVLTFLKPSLKQFGDSFKLTCS